MSKFYSIQGRRKLFNYNLTFLLIAINVIAFVVFTILSSTNLVPIDFIAIKPSNVINNFYFWTFITSMFMHAGFFHIFANMISLMFMGGLLERILGKKRFLFLYLICGLFAGLFFVLASWIMKIYFGFAGDYNTYAVGASGAIFGLIGLMMVITPNLPVYIMFIPIPVKIKYAAPGMLVLLWLISIAGNIPIGNTAHLGGFVIGLFYGIYLKKKYKNKTRYISKVFS